ncbi:CIC11C00000002866 [Sungouiella intermedia]|uniref:CIC11C00000002866 n=1 Tax=Sungouiella intermedia TaxID=45354 RepID=A0A1L0BTH7_9ASCO|nr:CIC11C00000002866 [[Candida] intermedia]
MIRPVVLHTDPIRFAAKDWEIFENEVDVEVVHLDKSYSREQFIEDLHGKYSNCVAIARGYLAIRSVGRFDEELVLHFPPSLKYIAHQGAGYDQNDVAPMTAKGIQLAHCPGVVNNSTADTNIFLMLLAMRNFGAGSAALKKGYWPTKGNSAGVQAGINPANKVLGIVGMGGIGLAVRDRARVFGFEKIVYYNRSRVSADKEQDSEYCESLEKLVEVADRSTLSKMKDGVVIVNTARGEVIDETALIKHLKSGKVGAAGLDVFENEPRINMELLEFENVVATPHMGTNTEQTVHAMEAQVIRNIRAGIETGHVENLVPEQTGKF